MTDSSSNNLIDRSSIGDGPLLLTLLMGNNNNNSAAQAQLQDILDTLNPRNFSLELKPTQSDVSEEFDNDLSVVNNDGDDGPLLFSLLLTNQNNNYLATVGTTVDDDGVIPDTLDPRHIALEQISSQSPLEKANDFSSSKIYAKNDIPSSSTNSEDGPLLFALLLNNQNNNNNPNASIANLSSPEDTLDPKNIALELKAPEDDDLNNNKILDDGEDGPLLLTMLLANQNNNNPNPLIPRADPISDTLDARSTVLELKAPVDDGLHGNKILDDGEDGPIAFALMLGNNMNYLNPWISQATPIADTLDPRTTVLELNASMIDGLNSNKRLVDFADELPPSSSILGQKETATASDTSLENEHFSHTLNSRDGGLELKYMDGDRSRAVDIPGDDHDGPLPMTLLLKNQNQNQQAVADCQISDTLGLKHAAIELNLHANDAEIANGRHGPSDFSPNLNESNYKPGDTITESLPDFTEIKSQLLELHSHGCIIKEAVPVIFKWGSQIFQGRLVPVTRGTKNGVNPPTQAKFDQTPIIENTILSFLSELSVSKPHITPNEENKGRLNDEQLQFWKDNGYLIIPNALPTIQKDLLLKNVHDAAESLARGGERVQKHSYLPGQEFYVHPSGRAIATLTEYAFKPDTEPLKRIQRLGCGIHRVMPAFRKAIFTPFHTELAKSLGYKDPRIIQTLIIVKAAEVGARVIPHQDGCSGFTDPSSCTTFWYALEDCTTENGCLAVAPGSHRTQPITRRCRMNKNRAPEFFNLDRPVFAEIEGVSDTAPLGKNKDGELQYKKLEVEAGSLVLMHGNLMHTSEANHSSKSRVAFNFNVVEGELDWLADNYLQPYEGETEFEKLNVK
ncbi:hypothetical protein EYC80_003764 [Monilinia laxa]|uniref:Uncharacterized protein n=1 Tax=Monilinia laxa TaxID=61186 RepID=A0A5N6KKQ4_MONLA|nr:hypothetical protein EYC80_003764 [Monilinia laxa]